MRVLRVMSLFLVYGGIGWMGDQTAALLAEERDAEQVRVIRVDADLERVVEIEVDVQVRTGGACAFEVERRVALELGEGGTLAIAAAAGSLEVEGRDGTDEVVAVGRVCASSTDILERLELSAERAGRQIRLSAHDGDGSGWGEAGETARIDLTVTMPAGTSVDIADSSGDITVRASGDLRIADSSGGIDVRGALGSVRIEDGSGDIEVEDVTGDLEIRDGSGGIRVARVAGAVAVRDGSGRIEIAQVGRDVLIEADGSGSIRVSEVGGDFVVERDGSGEITYAGVTGRVDVPARSRRSGR